jgi:hypothetical protein
MDRLLANLGTRLPGHQGSEISCCGSCGTSGPPKIIIYVKRGHLIMSRLQTVVFRLFVYVYVYVFFWP